MSRRERKKGAPHDALTKYRALQMAAEVGPAKAAETMGISPHVVRDWARAAGLRRRWKSARKGRSRLNVDIDPKVRDQMIDEAEHRGLSLGQATEEAIRRWLEWSIEQPPVDEEEEAS